MVIVAQQPCYLPWLGYFELLARADRFVLLNDVQWNRLSFQRRTRIIDKNNKTTDPTRWLTIPLEQSHQKMNINELAVDADKNWPEQHWDIILQTYRDHPYFRDQILALEPLFATMSQLNRPGVLLEDIVNHSIQWLAYFIGMRELESKFAQSSDYDVTSLKTDRLIELCQKLGASVYYSAPSSTRYIELGKFREADIDLFWQRFHEPQYDQKTGQNFRSHLSIVDALANISLEQIQESLKPNPWRPLISRKELLGRLSQ